MTISVEALTQVSWRCIHFAPAVEARLVQTNLRGRAVVRTLDGAAIRSAPDLFVSLAHALAFPAYFGRNWDALDECLGDLDAWLPAPAYCLFITNADRLWTVAGPVAGELIDVWLKAAAAWAGREIPFHLVFVWPASRS